MTDLKISTSKSMQDASDTFPMVSDFTYECALLFWKTVCNIFFRETRPRGAYNIPREGPVILVAAPHSNQVRLLYDLTLVEHALNGRWL
jgi:1-acyl-sn-glycerol-3-phosphate acyltransferase